MPLPSLRHHCPKGWDILAATSGPTELQQQHWDWVICLQDRSHRETEIVSRYSVTAGLANSVPVLHYCQTVPVPRQVGMQVGEAYCKQCSQVDVRLVVKCESLTCRTVRCGRMRILKAGVFLADIFRTCGSPDGLGGRLQKRSACCGQNRAPLFSILACTERMG